MAEVFILSTGEASELLALKKHQLDYLIETGRVMKPRKSLFGRVFFYTLEDLIEMRKIVDEEKRG